MEPDGAFAPTGQALLKLGKPVIGPSRRSFTRRFSGG